MPVGAVTGKSQGREKKTSPETQNRIRVDHETEVLGVVLNVQRKPKKEGEAKECELAG